MSKKVLEFENVSFAYNETEVLKDISFSLDEGDYLGIIGENGTGKTTLMRLILGFLQYNTGSIKVFGEERKKFKNTGLFGYVSQKANAFSSDFPATVYEVVSAGLYAHKGFLNFPGKKDREKVLNALDMVDMAEYKNRLIGKLSGGQQQRVFIARTLVSNPKLMILDEPTVGIDAKSVDTVTSIIEKLNNQGKTIIMTNHDTHALKKEANKLLILKKDGRAELEIIR